MRNRKLITLIIVLLLLPFLVAAIGLLSLGLYAATTDNNVTYISDGFGLTVSTVGFNAMPGTGNGVATIKPKFVFVGDKATSAGPVQVICTSDRNQGFDAGGVDFRYWECK